jgi:hypothetical protein
VIVDADKKAGKIKVEVSKRVGEKEGAKASREVSSGYGSRKRPAS